MEFYWALDVVEDFKERCWMTYGSGLILHLKGFKTNVG
jgi:hypothetical protein